MSRIGTWMPTTAEARLDRMESLAEIRQLAYRYALAVDSRDIDGLVDLFVPDVRVGADEFGRDALKRWFTQTLRKFKTTVHFVGNHTVDFDDADHAHGIVYCHDELERPETGEWHTGKLQYRDTYVRVDGEWCFQRRKFLRWYLVDALARPAHGADANGGNEPRSTLLLPDAFETWGPFWAAAGENVS
jgi:ketosteroid isomerase-like protein